MAGRRIPTRVREQVAQRRIFVYQGLQPLGIRTVVACQETGFSHHTQRAATVGERNEPVPYIAMFWMHRNPNLVAVESRQRDTVFDVRENRFAHWETRWGFQSEQARQNPAKAAGVEQEPGLDDIFFAL